LAEVGSGGKSGVRETGWGVKLGRTNRALPSAELMRHVEGLTPIACHHAAPDPRNL